MNDIKIEIASVKVMRSHDYCHFEVCLSSSSANTPELVDEMRKTAARLADKAVAQYKIAKNNIEMAMDDESRIQSLKYRHRDILEKPESERSPDEKAIVKAFDDRAHRVRVAYDYQDQWHEPDWEDEDDSMF